MCEDNLLLVNAVKKHQCLYNFSIPEYMKKDDTDAAWTEVARYMRQTGKDFVKNFTYTGSLRG